MKQVAVAIHATESFDLNQITSLKELDYIHVDVMDGVFVNNTMLNLKIFKEIKEKTTIPIIAHMMVKDPINYFRQIIEYVDYFLFHVESNANISEMIAKVKANHKKAGLVINPPTSVSKIIPFLKNIDIILVMGVNPGWSGQKFLKDTIQKVKTLAKFKEKYKFKIDVDGGINLENAKELHGADILSSSSTILNAENPHLVINQLKKSDIYIR